MSECVPRTRPFLGGRARTTISLLAGFLCAIPLFGQTLLHPTTPPAAAQPSAVSAVPADPLGLGRETPRGTVIGFIRTAQYENYDDAIQYFDPRRRSTPQQDKELAAQLLAVLNARLAISLDSISDSPQFPRDEIIVGGVRGAGESFPLQLVRLEVQPRGPKLWFISWRTLEQVPEVYDSLRFPQLANQLPRFLVKVRLLGVPLWQWVAIILLVPVALALAWVIAGFARVARQVFRRIRGLPPLPERRRRRRFGPGTLLVATIIHYNFVYWIGTSVLYRQYYFDFILILFGFALYWALTRISYWISLRIWNRLTDRGLLAERSLISLVRRVLDVAIFFVIGLLILRTLDANVPAALAGLGIGGLAIGLGAQKTFENLLGGISILTDKAIVVGDYCRIGDQQGVVEDIGLRSTKLRTIERTIVSIPNGTVATANLENFRLRDKILVKQTVRLRYDLSPDHLRYVLEQLREVLLRHPKVERETARVRAMKLAENAIEVEVFAYILTREYLEFVAAQEELLLQIMDTVEETGAALALPTQTTMVTRDQWVDPSKAAAAQKAMDKNRDPGVPGTQHPELAPDVVPPKR